MFVRVFTQDDPDLLPKAPETRYTSNEIDGNPRGGRTLPMASQPIDFLKALAHEVRWHIVLLLARSDRRVQELVTALGEPQNFVSYHLKQLRQLHIVTEHRSAADGRDIYYSLDLDQVRDLYRLTGATLHPALQYDESRRYRPPIAAPIRVLFLCSHNSARSQMAEGCLRAFSGGWIEAFSAGTQPTDLHPLAVQVMADLGIDITPQWAKPLDHVLESSYDYVVTVCDIARERCPAFPDTTDVMHWSLPDPTLAAGTLAEQRLVFAQTAQQIVKRVHALIRLIEQDQRSVA